MKTASIGTSCACVHAICGNTRASEGDITIGVIVLKGELTLENAYIIRQSVDPLDTPHGDVIVNFVFVYCKWSRAFRVLEKIPERGMIETPSHKIVAS